MANEYPSLNHPALQTVCHNNALPRALATTMTTGIIPTTYVRHD